MTRRKWSKKARAEIFARGGGRCHICGHKITGEWEADHVIALCAGGTDTIDNMLPAHVSCHREKTKGDVKVAAKIRRLRNGGRKRRGRKIPSRPFPKVKRPLRWRKKEDTR